MAGVGGRGARQVVTDGGSGQGSRDVRTLVEDAKALATVLAMEAESVLGRRAARFLGILALFAVVVGTLLFLLDWYIEPDKASVRKDLILTLAQILGGTALLSGLYFAWRGQQNAQNQLEIARRGQITERFTQAIDQLGSADLEIRLGGIYSLERTAYEDQDHHGPIMEVLTTYVREHAPWNPDDTPEKTPDETLAPEPDIQAILTVIGRRSIYHRSVEHGDINLRGVGLREANLWKADLSDADLREANLQGAYLSRADLREADLQGANLRLAKLPRADLRGAKLQGANLQEANLTDADLTSADLSGADLRGAYKKLTDEGPNQMITNEKLEQQANSLEGATLPDGSVHP